MGSPPRMRGKGASTPGGASGSRITPAYAGKSGCGFFYGFLNWDHPRVCGEKNVPFSAVGFELGSPPRMRGKAGLMPCPGAAPGITPAYAGKRLSPCAMCPVMKDHPRVCGEKCVLLTDACRLSGSPPRMRGKAMSLQKKDLDDGITPAYAGKRVKKGLREIVS